MARSTLTSTLPKKGGLSFDFFEGVISFTILISIYLLCLVKLNDKALLTIPCRTLELVMGLAFVAVTSISLKQCVKDVKSD